MDDFNLASGDILHVQVGIINDYGEVVHAEVDDIDEAQERWDRLVPDGVKVVVTTVAEEVSIIKVSEF